METTTIFSAPAFFKDLASIGCLSEDAVRHTSDGFWAVTSSIADILAKKGVTTFLNDQNQERECRNFFDDWYLYGVPWDCGYIYSLFKMREQEHDAENGRIADGDTPGVTISFIGFQTNILKKCLEDPSPANRQALNQEINRVVAKRGQRHHKALKAYFVRPQSEGAYLVAQLYVSFLAGLAETGYLPVPNHYAALCGEASGKKRRLPRFLDANNEAAGYPVCDHKMIRIRDPKNLTSYEKNALLATHTGDTSFHAFAAEVRYHACFLIPIAKIPVPFLNWSIYGSAIRADMTIEEAEIEGPTPYHNPNSRWIRLQRKYHNGSALSNSSEQQEHCLL